MALPRAEFHSHRILILRYPFAPGSCRKRLSIAAEHIQEADPNTCTLRVADELIYLPGWPRDELASFCLANGIPLRERYDAWTDILEPFADTSFSCSEIAERNTRLRVGGLSSSRVTGLRFVYCIPIILFQGIAGEWTGLYHYHLLHALRGLRLVGLYSFAYRHTMRVALEQYS
jgi:hypothetical protein